METDDLMIKRGFVIKSSISNYEEDLIRHLFHTSKLNEIKGFVESNSPKKIIYQMILTSSRGISGTGMSDKLKVFPLWTSIKCKLLSDRYIKISYQEAKQSDNFIYKYPVINFLAFVYINMTENAGKLLSGYTKQKGGRTIPSKSRNLGISCAKIL